MIQPSDDSIGDQKSTPNWNSTEEVFPGMTAGEAARFMAAFISAFRIFSIAESLEGRESLMKHVSKLIDFQVRAAYITPLPGVTEKSAERDTELGLAATAMAAIQVVSAIDSRQFCELSLTAMRAANEIMKSACDDKPVGNIKFIVRKAPDDGIIEVGVTIETPQQTQESMDKAGISKLIEDVTKEDNGKHNPGNN